MPRRREVPKREILPDPKFGTVDVSKFVNVLMLSGKKSVAERIIYGAFEQIEKKSGKDPLEVFTVAINNVQADGRSEVPPRRRCELPGAGGSSSVRRMALSMRWLRKRAQAQRKVDAATPGRRIAGSRGRPRRRNEEA